MEIILLLKNIINNPFTENTQGCHDISVFQDSSKLTIRITRVPLYTVSAFYAGILNTKTAGIYNFTSGLHSYHGLDELT